METTFIYALTEPNDINEVRYIGKANDPYKRFKDHLKQCLTEKHYKGNWIKSLLKRNELPELIILDEVLISEWDFWETYYYNLYKSWGFKLTNTALPGIGGQFKNCHSEEVRTKLRYLGIKNAKRKDGKILTDEEIEIRIQEKLNKIKVNKCILQISNKTNEIVSKYSCRKECIETLGLGKNKLDELLIGYQVISKGVTKKVKQWKGFVFVREKNYDVNKDYKVIPRRATKVYQYDLEGILLNTFESINLATEATGIPQPQISNCCKGRQKTANKFIFKYAD